VNPLAPKWVGLLKEQLRLLPGHSYALERRLLLQPSIFREPTSIFIFVGVVPAVVSYLSGYIVRLMLEFSWELCEAAAARCLRLLSDLAVYLAIRTSARVVALADGSERVIGLSLLMIGRCAESYDFRRKAYRVYRWSWRTRNAIFRFLCLLIRSTARFLIELQHLFERTRREQIARHAEQFPADSELRSSRARE
jgi:hypothetical protein